MTSIEIVKKYLADACIALGDGALPTQLQTILVAHMICQIETSVAAERFLEEQARHMKILEVRSRPLPPEKDSDDEQKVN